MKTVGPCTLDLVQGTYSTQLNQQWEFENGTASGYYYVANANAPIETWNVTGNGTTNGSFIPEGFRAGPRSSCLLSSELLQG